MLKFHELAPSPNSIKVRLALRAKGIDFAAVAVDPRDRAPIVALSGQELTPVIEDKGIVLNDSEAILHYLDANYRDGHTRLYGDDRAGRKACDAWRETVYAKLVPASGALFMHAIGMGSDPGDAGRQALRDACGWAQSQLADGALVDHPWPVCEIWLATWVSYAFPSAEMVAVSPLFTKIGEAFGLQAGEFPALEAWLAGWTARY